jgi:hypothetical protein
MTDIVTITPNPAVDLSTTVDRILPVVKLRGQWRRRQFSGGADLAACFGSIACSRLPPGSRRRPAPSRNGIVRPDDVARLADQVTIETG